MCIFIRIARREATPHVKRTEVVQIQTIRCEISVTDVGDWADVAYLDRPLI